MLILGLETSCDETACGVVRNGCEVLSSIVATQIARHAPFGGVVPEVAAREHLNNVDIVVSQALEQAGVSIDEIDAIAVTQGPGLIGALLVGVSYAKGLAAALEKPLIPINHVKAHVHGALLNSESAKADIFPCLSLVVSGGHTNLYFMEDITSFVLIAASIDDACGESFDKVAKLLGLAYPGGPKIEQLAKLGCSTAFEMPKMVENKQRLEFSYSGLKTHMVNLIRKHKDHLTDAMQQDMCASFQEEALGQIIRKMKSALERFPSTRSLLVAGGVSANQRFRELSAELKSVRVIFPPLEYCSDNGAMIAASGYHWWCAATEKSEFNWNIDWDAYSRGSGKL